MGERWKGSVGGRVWGAKVWWRVRWLDFCDRLPLQLRNHKEEAGPATCPIAKVNSTSQITTGKHLHFTPASKSV